MLVYYNRTQLGLPAEEDVKKIGKKRRGHGGNALGSHAPKPRGSMLNVRPSSSRMLPRKEACLYFRPCFARLLCRPPCGGKG